MRKKEHQSTECPESDRFLNDDEIQRGHKAYFSRGDCMKNYVRGNCEGSCEQEFLDYSEYYLLQEFAITDGFEEFTTEERVNKDGQIITTQKKIQGFYVDENRTRAIINEIANLDLVPDKITRQLKNLIDIDDIYEGFNYLLIKAGDKIFSFNIHFYQSFKEIIRLIDLHISCRIERYQTNESGSLLILDTGQTKFLIAGMTTSETLEEERDILSEKIQGAKPFFEFKAIRKVDWSKLKNDKGDYFEKLTETLLQLEPNIADIKTIGKTKAGDRGRDFIVTEKSYDTFGQTIEKKWLVQCKYSDKSIPPKTIPDWVNRTIEHSVDGYWLITNNDLTPDLFDQLNDVPKNKHYKFETRFWQRNTFDIKLMTRPEVFKNGLFFDE